MQHSKLYSILKGTCPRCHKGKIFIYKNAYKLTHLTKMHSRCPKCGLNYKPEPGFYFGAGYVSYALGVAIAVTISVGLSPWISFFENFELYAIIIISTIIILTPVLFRLSRTCWLNFFFKYDKEAISKYNESIKTL